MTSTHHIVIVGGGVMGSATAWQLTNRGYAVTLLEQGTRGHLHGASHGTCRNFNVTYQQDHYLTLLKEAETLWRRLESDSGRVLLDFTGLVNHGETTEYSSVHQALQRAGIRSEFLTPEEAGRRWSGIAFDTQVFFTPDAGRIYSDRSVEAMQELTAARGGALVYEASVTDIQQSEHGGVTVEYTLNGRSEIITADKVVVTAGAWTSKILGDLVPLPRLRVTQEQPMHFEPIGEHDWPSFNHRYDHREGKYDYWRGHIYGMLTPDEGVKAGWHAAGSEVDPDARDFLPEAQQATALRRYAAEYLPGVDPNAFEAISCTYTLTPDEDFILDRRGDIVVGAGFSGHGFKFAPAIGHVLADLAVGSAAAQPAFALHRW